MQDKIQRLRNPELPGIIMMLVAFSERREVLGSGEPSFRWRGNWSIARPISLPPIILVY